MTVGNVTIAPHKTLKNWFHLIFTSRKDGIGETKIELLVNEETLRMFRLQIKNAIGENCYELPEDFS